MNPKTEEAILVIVAIIGVLIQLAIYGLIIAFLWFGLKWFRQVI